MATTKLNAECPTCKTPLPIVVGSAATVRVAICEKCGDEYTYSAWVMLARKDVTFTKIELERVATGHATHHTRPLTSGGE